MKKSGSLYRAMYKEVMLQMRISNGKVANAAEVLGLSRQALYKKLEEFAAEGFKVPVARFKNG